MASLAENSYRIRKNFGKIKKVLEVPNLIKMQKESYERFLQMDVEAEHRKDFGLQGCFKHVFPIKDYSGASCLEFVKYSFGKSKYDVDECIQRGMNFDIPLRITVRLVIFDLDEEANTNNIRDIKEQEIYFGAIPLMTENGTFVINGTERVIVSQLQRSPGLFYDHDRGKTHSSGKILYSARIIPLRGSWIDIEFDHKDILYIRIDRRRKFPVTILLKALGYSAKDILNYFYDLERIYLKKDTCPCRGIIEKHLHGTKATADVKHPKTDEIIIKKDKKITRKALNIIADLGLKTIPISWEDMEGTILASDVIDTVSGDILLHANSMLDAESVLLLREKSIDYIDVLFIDRINHSSSMRDTLMLDKITTKDEAIIDIYRKLRPSSPPTIEVANIFFSSLFFKPENYDLSEVGRFKLNQQLGIDIPLDFRTLSSEDLLLAVKKLVHLKDSQGQVDDIDNLSNRRVRAVGELLENQYRIGLVRMERAIKERMNLQEIDTLMPNELINAKPVTAVVKEFFGTSQLSQFMDQNNALSEITHKRRLSALGPGGLTRERAGFEVRDVHPTHYGRICPIETPEGPNIGLIVSLSTYAYVNEYGFIETPYRVVKDGMVTNDVHFLSAMDEKEHIIAQANAKLDSKNCFINPFIASRQAGEAIMAPSNDVKYMDVSPNQLVSVATSLIPFLENDDANRALMGSNMQRQAVPLLKSSAPVVGTGVESVVALDSGVCVLAKRDGIIENIDAARIIVKSDTDNLDFDDSGVDIYNLKKFKRTNQSTCFSQKPIVSKGDWVRKGQVLADGSSTDLGTLALGKNIIVAFMPWGGYNYEDSILLSERLLKEDYFTSIHIEEFNTEARDTKLGKEEITRDIPNIGEENLGNLDDSGIVRIGAEVKSGDILVGKITPKGETQLSPEEKLLRAIFGEKAGDVKDSSLRVPPGIEGVVIDAKIFSRKGTDKDSRTRLIIEMEEEKILKNHDDEVKIIKNSALIRLSRLLKGCTAAASLKNRKTGDVLLEKGQEIILGRLKSIPVSQWREISVANNPALEIEIENIWLSFNNQVERLKLVADRKIEQLNEGDELHPGVIKMVKVYVAIKRKLSVGDKMAGRHGNKGVVSKILPVEDLPYFEDGSSVDIVLNPLGVPSRMNVGQVLETHLGWASRGIGKKIDELYRNYQIEAIRAKLKEIYNEEEYSTFFADATEEELCKVAERMKDGVSFNTPVFDGATEDEIHHYLKMGGLSETGQSKLYDGRTGEPFYRDVTVGIMYMLKLHHLVDEKIHARSIGPYSLVTQQPLGGKAQFGGQRLGEMEVWAMEAYGAAYSLQEFLTVKSDDVAGRTRMYEKIVKGDNTLEVGLPESFNVLIKELQALGLNIELLENE